MALNIRDPEVHELARKVANAAGETMTEAVRKALDERLNRIGQVSEAERRRRLAAMQDFAQLYRQAPIEDPRTPDEILGYDENGLADLMVVDTSALLAILLGEEDAEQIGILIAGTAEPLVSAVAVVEFGMIALSRSGFSAADVERRLQDWGLIILPVTALSARLALAAFARYGRGRHPAKLNFGDCFAYALAKERDLPLLFKGNDFALTDIARAL